MLVVNRLDDTRPAIVHAAGPLRLSPLWSAIS